MAWKVLFEEPVPETARGRTMLIRIDGEELRESVPGNAVLAIVEVDKDKNARRIRFKLAETETPEEPETPEAEERYSVFWLND